MKTIKIGYLLAILLFIAGFSFGQNTTTDTFRVSGECGTCKKKIEKAAKEAGATFAVWNVDSKILTVKYDSASTNAVKIQQSVANTGYDTPGFKATEEAYNKLSKCCQYEREDVKKACCDNEKCSKDGCTDMDCCKKNGSVVMDCCKDDKCTREGHNGKDCCKKS